MTTPQIIAAGAALLVFAALLLLSPTLRIRPWVIALAGLVGLGLAVLIGVLVGRVASLQELAIGVGLLCFGGALMPLAVILLARRGSGRMYAPPGGARMIPAAREGRSAKGKPMALTEAQNQEIEMLAQPANPELQEPKPKNAMPEGSEPGATGAEAITLPEAEESALPEASVAAVDPARVEIAAQPDDKAEPAEDAKPAAAEPEAGQPAQAAEPEPGISIAGVTEENAAPEDPAAATESREEEIERLDKLFREEQARIAREAEEQILEEARRAREEEARKAEQHRLLEEEVRSTERERTARQEERRRHERERRARKEEERRLKQEKQRDAVAAEEAQLIRERIQAERQKVAERELLRQQEQAVAEKAAEKAAAHVLAAIPAEDTALWQSEQERLALELEARRIAQKQAEQEELAWLEEQQRLAREAEELEIARQKAAEEAERLRLEQERLEREAEERRLEEERLAREQAERAQERIREAEECLTAGLELTAAGRPMEALRSLERAARLDVPQEWKTRANVAIVEALLAMGWKAEAMKKLQAMKGLSMDPSDRKRLDAILRKAI